MGYGRKAPATLMLVILAGCATYSPPWTPATAGPPETPPSTLNVGPPLESKAAPVTPPDTPQTPVPITRDSAILTALLHNRKIEVARFGSEIGRTYVPEARAEFDPRLLGELNFTDTERDLDVAGTNAAAAQVSAGGTGDPAQDVVRLLDTTREFLTVLRDAETLDIETRDRSLSVVQRFPTGTEVVLSGTDSSLDTNLTGRQDETGLSVEVNQALLEGAGLNVNLVTLRQARNRAAQSELAFREQVVALTREVERAYWDLVLAKQVLAIRQFAVQLADEQLRRNKELMRVGKIIEGDVIAARAEKATRLAELRDAEGALRNQTLAMVQLLNPPAADNWNLQFEPIDKPEVVPAEVDPAVSENLARQYRPDLAQARLDVANSGLDVVRTKNQLRPRLDLVGAYASTRVRGDRSFSSGFSNSMSGLGAGDSDSYSIGLQLEQPILNRAERARHQRAKLIEKQAAKSVVNLEQTVAREVRQAGVDIEKQWQRIEATQEALQSRTEQLRVAQGRYDVGRITNLDLLIVQRDLIAAQVDDATARIHYIQALTELYAAEGTLLERRGISLDWARNVPPSQNQNEASE